MNSHDTVERVLKEIHIEFANCETYNGQPDKIIADRRKFLNLLDRLNQGIFEMMEQYEHTRQSRENAELEFRRQGDEIIAEANKSAEDVYAASVIYTSDMLGRIRDLMDDTNNSMNDLFRQFRRELRAQKDLVTRHETELQGQLADMADTRKYLSIIDDINKEREWKNRDLQAEREAGERYVRNIVRTPSANAEVKVNEQYFEKTGKTEPAAGEEPKAAGEKPDIKVNTDAAYFKWKEDQEKAEAGREAAAEEQTAQKAPEEIKEPAPKTAEETDGGAQAELPSEEAILQAVLADEREAEAEADAEAGQDAEDGQREESGARTILKNLIFGKE